MQGHYGSYQSTFTAGTAPGMPSLFPVQIGADVSGTFVMSLYGLAVIRPDGRAIIHRDRGLIDVSLFLLPGFNFGVYRIPVTKVARGDLIVTSDFPLSLLYVHKQTESGFEGLDPFTGNLVFYHAPLSPLFNYVVRVQSLFGTLFAETEEVEEEDGGTDKPDGPDRDDGLLGLLLPLLLFGSQGQSTSTSTSTSPITLLLLMQVLGRRFER